VEIFFTEAQTGDAHFANRLEFVIGERSRLALESDFPGFIPRQQCLHAIGQMLELIDGEIRRSAAAEVNEGRLATADEGFRGVKRQFLEHRVEVASDRRRILVRINFEVTKVAALPAKGNV